MRNNQQTSGTFIEPQITTTHTYYGDNPLQTTPPFSNTTITTAVSTFSIIGKWEDTSLQNSVQFTGDGYVVINYGGSLVSGTYQLIGDDVVTLHFEGSTGHSNGVFAANTWQYTISGDTLFVQANGTSDVFILEKLTTHNLPVIYIG